MDFRQVSVPPVFDFTLKREIPFEARAHSVRPCVDIIPYGGAVRDRKIYPTQPIHLETPRDMLYNQ